MKKAYNRGFTLVEIIIVVAVIAVLMAVLIPVYAQYVSSSRVSVCEDARGEMIHYYEASRRLDSDGSTEVKPEPLTLSEDIYILQAGLRENGASDIETEGEDVVSCTGLCPDDATAEFTFKLNADGSVNEVRCSNPQHLHSVVSGDGSGGSGGGGDDPPAQTLEDLAHGIFDVYKKLKVPSSVTQVDSLAAGQTTTWAYKFYSGLNPAQQAALNGYTWAFRGSGNDTRMYLTQGIYSDTESKSGLLVYKYDMGRNQFQCTNSGIVTNGKLDIKSIPGAPWGDWCNTMKEAAEKAK